MFTVYGLFHNYTFCNAKEHFHKVLVKMPLLFWPKSYKSVPLHYKTYNYVTNCINMYKYSRCPNTGRPVWQTGRKYVRFSDTSEIANVWIPAVFVRISEKTSEIRTFWEPDTFRKCQNPDVRISDIHCIWNKYGLETFQYRGEKIWHLVSFWKCPTLCLSLN